MIDQTDTDQAWALAEDADFADAWARAAPYTMTGLARGYALWRAVNHVLDAGVPGCFVECGVWRGGSAFLIAQALARRGARDRTLILFDTFAGMTAPGSADLDLRGDPADALMSGLRGASAAAAVRAEATEQEVRALLAQADLDRRQLRIVAGDVRQTAARTQTMAIALLRLDTDFYDSTLAELRHLYPRLSRGGVAIIDDYGHWRGARQAVDEYFGDAAARPMLWAIDYTGRGLIKPEDAGEVEIPRYDYQPPGMADPGLLAHFPHAQPMNPWTVAWPWLRPQTPHLYRSDDRDDAPWHTGNASVEEALCLHAVARPFAGRRGVEIGTHFGWTAAHLRAAGLALDLIDPAFAKPGREEAVRVALDAAAPDGPPARIWAAESPAALDAAAAGDEPWSFAFIDGDHEGEAPLHDALAVAERMAPDATVMFHDMTAPAVARGLTALSDAGWSTRLYNTMQVLGVAWRGDAPEPPAHVPDPNTPPIYAPHLARWSGGATGKTSSMREADAVQNDLIFDIGLHKGFDAEFYLKKGFRVVGLEASPELAALSRQHLAAFGERLAIVEKALFTEPGAEVTFYTVPGKDDWGSLEKGTAEKGVETAVPITVETIDLSSLIDRYGVPRYIKCDIEGADLIFRDQLRRETRRPTFVSIEVNDGQEGAVLAECGYELGQIVNQWFNPWRQPPEPPREGCFTPATFNHEMSGLFGRELPPERWRPIGEIDAITRRWGELRAIDESLVPGWLDVHATTRAALA